MKKFLIAIVVLVVLLVGAVLVVPGLIPWDNYKGEIAEMARDATGREVRIDGPIKLSVLPRVELQVGRTSLANAEGAAEPNMVELAELRLALQVMPLITGRVAVDEFVLINPVIHLEIDKDGRPNWEFQGTAAAEKPAATSGATQPSAPSGDGGLGIADLQLGDVRIVDGHVSFRDAGSGQSQVFEKVNLTVKLPDLASPFSA